MNLQFDFTKVYREKMKIKLFFTRMQEANTAILLQNLLLLSLGAYI